MHLLARLIAFLPVLCFTGCLQIDAVVKLKSDGSGTIEQKVMMGGAIVEQMKSMAAAFGGDKSTSAKGNGLYDEAKLKSRAAEMGQGVTFVSGKVETGADGSEGYSAVYAFTDINKLKLKASPGDFGPQSGAVKMKSSGKEPPLTFQFSKGRPASLTILNPRSKPDPAKADAPKSPEDAMQDAMLPMMQQMLKDMRMNVAVEVNGRIVETNAQWTDGSRVTLMDLEMNKVLADPAKFKAMAKFKDPSSPEAKALIASVPGIKVETADSVTVKFQ